MVYDDSNPVDESEKTVGPGGMNWLPGRKAVPKLPPDGSLALEGSGSRH